MGKVDYAGLLESLKEDTLKTEKYLTERYEALNKSKQLLVSKEEELQKVTEYVYLLQNVVQGLRFAIQMGEHELFALKEQLKHCESYKESLEGISSLLDESLKQVQSGPFKTDIKRPEIGVQLQTVAEAAKEAEELTANLDVDEASKGSVVSTKTQKVSNNNESLKAGKVEKSVPEKDDEYLEYALSYCETPKEADLLSIWKRRVLVKHYMEQNMSQVQKVVQRYNEWAKYSDGVLGTKSSISKDMMKILEGNFNLKAKDSSKDSNIINLKFQPISMLTHAERGQLFTTIEAMKKKYKGKTNYIKDYVEKYARTELEEMSAYKIKAVQAFISAHVTDR